MMHMEDQKCNGRGEWEREKVVARREIERLKVELREETRRSKSCGRRGHSLKLIVRRIM